MSKIRLFLSSAVICTTLYNCSNRDHLESGTENQSVQSLNSIYDGPGTELIKNRISVNPSTGASAAITSSTALSSYCNEIVESQEKIFNTFASLEQLPPSLMWPGNLIQGNTIKEGSLSSIPIAPTGRNPIEVKVDALLSGGSTSSTTISDPSPGKVQEALGNILDSYYSSGTKFPANYNINIERAFNEEQLQLALNIGYAGISGLGAGAVAGSFGVKFSKNKNYYAVTLKQKFFDVSVANKGALQGEFGWIKTGYPVNQFNQFISPTNPAVYISSVTYGRLYVFIYESDLYSLELEQALRYAFFGYGVGGGTLDSKYKKILSQSKVYARQIGGSSFNGLSGTLESIAGNYDEINKFIKNGAEVSKENPGYPIEYTAVNINDSKPVTIKYQQNIKYKECSSMDPNLALSYNEAIDKVNRLKSSYGKGVSAKILIFNNTDSDMLFDSKRAWNGDSFYSNPPRYIPPGQYGVVLAVKKPLTATGIHNEIMYKLSGSSKLVGLATHVPWSAWGESPNKISVKFTNSYGDHLWRYNNSTAEEGKYKLFGSMGGGTSPLVEFEVKN